MKYQHIHWKPEYQLDIEAIDAQHHYFSELINRLADELEQSSHLGYQNALLNELKAYARFHFISEENLMFRAGYPQLDAHKQHHRELIDKLSSRVGKLQITSSDDSAERIIEFLVEWFVLHTIHEDMLFAEWQRNQNS